ncbi:hypothetical protein HA075_22775 [bacterium BFN5]|nr:hypothetical protein HA075_22775 [bacterium BFN5]
MKKKAIAFVVGGLLFLSAFGYSSYAAEQIDDQKAIHSSMMNGGHGDMTQMMKDPEMEKKCIEMMKSPEMQAMMANLMKTPEMQGVVKQMIQNDPELYKIMQDLVNSIDMNDHAASGGSTNLTNHGSHHQ